MATYIEILKPGRRYVSKRVTSRDINDLGIEFEKNDRGYRFYDQDPFSDNKEMRKRHNISETTYFGKEHTKEQLAKVLETYKGLMPTMETNSWNRIVNDPEEGWRPLLEEEYAFIEASHEASYAYALFPGNNSTNPKINGLKGQEPLVEISSNYKCICLGETVSLEYVTLRVPEIQKLVDSDANRFVRTRDGKWLELEEDDVVMDV